MQGEHPGQASADLYMGVTTVVAITSDRRGWTNRIDQSARPTPHLYLLDSIGSTDDWSLLTTLAIADWLVKLKGPPGRSVELSPDDIARQLATPPDWEHVSYG